MKFYSFVYKSFFGYYDKKFYKTNNDSSRHEDLSKFSKRGLFTPLFITKNKWIKNLKTHENDEYRSYQKEVTEKGLNGTRVT